MVLGSSLGLDVTTIPGGSIGHPDQHVPHITAVLGHQDRHRWPRPLSLTQSSMVSGDTDSNTDPGSSRAMDPQKTLGCIPGPDTTVAPVYSPGHSN